MMRFLWNLSLLVAFLCSNVLSEKLALAQGRVVRRQIFTTLPTVCTGNTCPKTTSSSTSTKSSSSSSTTRTTSSSLSSASKTSSSSSTSSRISSVSSTTSAASSVSYNQYAVTTTFTQPPSCTDGFTAIEDWGTDIYNNLIYSQSGFDLEYTTCFPPQFYSSVLASIASTTLGPFTALICPYTWESYDINSTYVICCPSGYSLLAPNFDDPIRPGAGAVCTSSIGGGGLLDITSFDSTGGETLVAATAGSEGTYVWANAFDGFTTSVSIPSTSSSASVLTTTSSFASKSSSSSKVTSSSTSTSSFLSKTSSNSIPKTTSSSTSKSSSSSKVTSSSTSASSSSSKTSSNSIPKTTSSSTLKSSLSSKVTSSSTSKFSSSSKTITSTGTAIPGESNLPACGQLCFNNMLAQYSTLGCAPLDGYCLCNNPNFGFGLRDCSNGACGTSVASTVIAFGSAYCSTATATHRGVTTTTSTTSAVIPGESNLPACGQLCFNNMLAQYSSLGCAPLDSYCLCSNPNFGFGIRDCSNGACGTAVASTVIAFGSAYCSTATATHTV